MLSVNHSISARASAPFGRRTVHQNGRLLFRRPNQILVSSRFDFAKFRRNQLSFPFSLRCNVRRKGSLSRNPRAATRARAAPTKEEYRTSPRSAEAAGTAPQHPSVRIERTPPPRARLAPTSSSSPMYGVAVSSEDDSAARALVERRALVQEGTRGAILGSSETAVHRDGVAARRAVGGVRSMRTGRWGVGVMCSRLIPIEGCPIRHSFGGCASANDGIPSPIVKCVGR